MVGDSTLALRAANAGWEAAKTLAKAEGTGTWQQARTFLATRSRNERKAVLAGDIPGDLLVAFREFLDANPVHRKAYRKKGFSAESRRLAGRGAKVSWAIARKLKDYAGVGMTSQARRFLATRSKEDRDAIAKSDLRSPIVRGLVEAFKATLGPIDAEWTMPASTSTHDAKYVEVSVPRGLVVQAESNGHAERLGGLTLIRALRPLCEQFGVETVSDAVETIRELVKSCT